MTPKEFKAWFEGFTEAFAGCPTKAQWARIKGRVAEIDGKETTERVFVDRYWPYSHWIWHNGQPIYSQPPPTVPVWVTNTANTCMPTFNATSAMYALGVADAGSITVQS